MPSINRLVFSCCLTSALCATAGAQTEHARFDFPATIEGRQHILTYDGTHDVSKDADLRIKLVIFVHHGSSQNPTTYFKHLTGARSR